MGAAAYNRGTRRIAMQAELDASVAIRRADNRAQSDELALLRAAVVRLERELSRARRCLASERMGREQLRLRLLASERDYQSSISILCKLAFPTTEKEFDS